MLLENSIAFVHNLRVLNTNLLIFIYHRNKASFVIKFIHFYRKLSFLDYENCDISLLSTEYSFFSKKEIHMSTEENREVQAPKVSGWLRKLADESWQAELIISGIAIFGTLSLPELITEVGNWCLITFAEDKFFLLGMIMIYLYVMSGGLIVAFLVHFFIRILWVGMLGLSSVYPKGILPIKSYSDHFNEKIKEEFPDLEAYSHSLDQKGSLIFSIASAMVMVAISSIFMVAVIMILASLIHQLLPAFPFNAGVGIIFFLIMIPTIMGMAFHAKKLKDKAWVRKYQFPIFRISAKAIYTIFYQPFNYIIYILISNSAKQSNSVTMLLVGISMGIFAAAATSQSNVKFFMNSDAFRRHANPLYGMKSTFYEDQRKTDDIILYASLESDVLRGKFVKAFVPIMGREEEARDALCGEYDRGEGPSTTATKLAAQKFENDCLQKYLTVYLNGEPAQDYSLAKYDHPQTRQFGVNLYISCEDCKIGENELKISRPYPLRAEKPYEVFLPFIYEGMRE